MSQMNLSAAVGATILFVSSLGAADSVKGTVTFNAERATPSFAVGVWREAKQEITVGLFPKELDTATQTRAIKEGFCCFGFSGGPFVVIDLRLTKGAKSLAPAVVDSCHIGFYGFKDSAFDYNAFGEKCGVVALAGAVKPGGLVTATVKGKDSTAAMGSFKAKTYAWDVAFEVTLRTP